MKKQKGLYILIGVLVIMIGLYFGLTKINESKKNQEADKTRAEQIKITDIKDIKKVSYTNGTDNMSFEKDGKEWKVSGNSEFPLAQSDAQDIGDLVSNLTAVRQLKDTDELSDYGLDAPQYTLTAVGSDGVETKLLVGKASGEDYYVMAKGKNTVYTIDNTLVSSLKFSLEDLIELEAFPSVTQSTLKKISITKNGETQSYSASEDKDKEKISTIAGGLGALKIEKCLNYNADEAALSSYGLSEADRTKVEVEYKDSEADSNKTLIFYIGGNTDDGASSYVQMDGSKMVNQVSASTLKNVLGGE